MNILTTLHATGEIVDISDAIAENDPHGFIITIVSVGVVFAALMLLYIAYRFIGKVTNWYHVLPEDMPDSDKMDCEDKMVHDIESYKITIRKEYSPSSRSALTDVAMHETRHSSSSAADINVTAPLPGVIIAVKVNVGDQIKAGQTVAILEAMKMENELQAEHAGTVLAVNVSKGDSVLEGTTIVTIK